MSPLTFLFKAWASAMLPILAMPLGLPLLGMPKLTEPSAAPAATATPLSRFASCAALRDSIAQATPSGADYLTKGAVPLAAPTTAAPTTGAVAQKSAEAAPADGYSRTNVQVQGVDEADIIKLDGQRAYHLTKNRLAVSLINPPAQAKLLSVTDFGQEFTAQDLYLEDGRVMVLGRRYESRVYAEPLTGVSAKAAPSYMPWRGRQVTVAQVFDVADPASPKKLRTVEFDGSLSSSRLIQGRVYLVMNSWSPWEQAGDDETALVPAYRDSVQGETFKPLARCIDISYFDAHPERQYLAVASLAMSGSGEVKRQVILGSSDTVYASTDNLYVARQDWSSAPVRDTDDPSSLEREQTVINKFALKDGAITFLARGKVPGRLLYQFSLDEYAGDLRVATTKGHVWDTQNLSTNNLYVLSADLKVRGRLEGIAPGERIYSARFTGKRGYLVTFKKVDPFFVLDLSNPDAPKILGKLKIPGYSDYLHPMDDGHVIGIGKNTVEASEGAFAWYQGMKLAVFDVTDVANPRELWKTEIGDRGTDSPALSDHKAFLYSPAKQLLVLPIRLAELPPEVKADPSREGNEYGDFKFQGAYVWRLTLQKGFELLGRVTHQPNDDQFLKSGYHYGYSDDDVERAHYVGDTLLTFSNNQIQLHHLYDLAAYGKIEYPKASEIEPYPLILD